MFHLDVTLVSHGSQEQIIKKVREIIMGITQKRILIFVIIVIVAFVLGRLAVRAIMNLMLGGTMFGGNFL